MAYSKKEITKFKEKIIRLLSEGNSLKSILDNDKELPNRTTVYAWLNGASDKYDQEFYNNYARAKEDSAELDADRVEEIAEQVLKKGYEPNAARVAIDAYKWAAGKKKPKKYGDKVTTEHSGEIKTNINLTDEQLQRVIDGLKPES